MGESSSPIHSASAVTAVPLPFTSPMACLCPASNSPESKYRVDQIVPDPETRPHHQRLTKAGVFQAVQKSALLLRLCLWITRCLWRLRVARLPLLWLCVLLHIIS